MSAANDLRRNWRGGNWIRPERRLGLYLRDGMACVWCLAAVEEEGVRLSLDHVVPNVKGGGNESTNLITACTRCNSARGSRPVMEFALAVRDYVNDGTTARQIAGRVRAAVRKAVPIAEAKRMIAGRTVGTINQLQEKAS